MMIIIVSGNNCFWHSIACLRNQESNPVQTTGCIILRVAKETSLTARSNQENTTVNTICCNFFRVANDFFFTYAKKTKGVCPCARTPAQKQKQTLFCTNKSRKQPIKHYIVCVFFREAKDFFLTFNS